MPRSPPDNRLNRPNSLGFLRGAFRLLMALMLALPALFSMALSSSDFHSALASDAAVIAFFSAVMAGGSTWLCFFFIFFLIMLSICMFLYESGNKLSSRPSALAVRFAPAKSPSRRSARISRLNLRNGMVAAVIASFPFPLAKSFRLYGTVGITRLLYAIIYPLNLVPQSQ